MIRYISIVIPFSILILSCDVEPEMENTDSDEQIVTPITDSVQTDITEESVPVLKAKLDTLAMQQVQQWTDVNYNDVFALYHSGPDVVERWPDKLWGRCCTEADMRVSEHLSYKVSSSHEGKEYPWKNVLDNSYNTAFVFEEKDSIVITVQLDTDENFYGHYDDKTFYDLISKTDTIMSRFQFSLINGYVKSTKTYEENARIKTVELWLNGSHMCNVELLDTAAIQMIEGNFPLFSEDVIEIKPIAYNKGSRFNDVCITTVQRNLGYSCHPGIDDKMKFGE